MESCLDLLSLPKVLMASLRFVCPQNDTTTLVPLRNNHQGAWVAQAMILWFISSSPASGSVVTVQSLEPAQILCLPLPCSCSHSQTLKKFKDLVMNPRTQCF